MAHKPKKLDIVEGSDAGSFTFTPTIGMFRCPCGGTAQTGTVGTTVTMIHSQPPCEKFVKLEPHEYVRWVRLNGGVVLD